MRPKKGKLLGILAATFVAQMALQVGLIQENWKKNYWAGQGFAESLSPDQTLLQLFGFREFLAGILWVRADSFFDEGNYDAVLPIIRLCTILDPKQIDIYSTGMWHIAYNFTDEEQRSDRRYIPAALALGKEGSKQNPNTYELFFETGWIWYHKVDDEYHNAIKWFRQAQEREDMLPARRNLLSNAYQRNNQVREGLDLYWKFFSEVDEKYKNSPDSEYQLFQQKETLESNLDTMIVRMVQRGWEAQQRGDYDKQVYDTTNPFDVGFSARVIVDSPKVLRVQGTWNVLPVGTRIRIVIRDANNPKFKIAAMDWDGQSEVNFDPERDSTYLQDQGFVKNRRFNKTIDMSKDPTMYPFSRKHDEYLVEFYYNARSAALHIQDKFGWNGEGMTDKNFLRTDIRKDYEWVPGEKAGKFTDNWKLTERNSPPARIIYTSLKLTRDQVLRKGDWIDRVPMVATKNFDSSRFSITQEDIIDIPTLRSSAARPGTDVKKEQEAIKGAPGFRPQK